MRKSRKELDEAVEATTFFNRGRRYSADIVRDNEQLRSKIRRLEQALRGAGEGGSRRGSNDGSADER